VGGFGRASNLELQHTDRMLLSGNWELASGNSPENLLRVRRWRRKQRHTLKGVDYKIIGVDGREYTASTVDELRAWITDGRVGPGTLVWSGEEQRWQPASAWPELRWDLPSAPPVIPVVSRPEPRMHNAEFPIRAAAYILDVFIVAALFSLITLPWAEHYRELQEAALKESAKAVPDIQVLLRFYALFLSTFLPLRLAYFVGFHAGLGATPGKLLFGLRVVRVDGVPLTFPRALFRFLAELVSIASMGIGYLVAPLHPERRALHDLMAGTRVIRKPVDEAVVRDQA
jgi:uncharacterized RDD family membrane protein YckC